MNSKNSTLVDPDEGIFDVLNVVRVRISSPLWTNISDIDGELARGAIFNFYEVGKDRVKNRAIASIEIVDVSSDCSEPDISCLQQGDVAELDRQMHQMISEGLVAQEMLLVKWMSSKLNEADEFKGLVTAYIVEDGGKERQFIALRFSAGNRKMVAMGTFDVDKSKELAAPIFGIMRNMKVNPAYVSGYSH